MTALNGYEQVSLEAQAQRKAKVYTQEASPSSTSECSTIAAAEECINSSDSVLLPSASSSSSASSSPPSSSSSSSLKDNMSADKPNDLFRIVNIAGSGVSGQVYRVLNTQDGCAYALKVVQFHNNRSMIAFQNECQMLSALQKQNGVIKIIHCYTTPSCGYLITQCGQLDLFNYAVQVGGMEELAAKHCVRQLVESVQQLHDVHGIVHRDLKPENVVMMPTAAAHKTKSASSIALIDFADALMVGEDWEVSDMFVGTTCYLAPERWRKHYHWECKASEMWSIGVLTYEILTNKRCFYDDPKTTLADKIKNGIWAFPENFQGSYLCRHFIQTLLCIDTHKRPSARVILQHPWLNTYENEQQMQLAIVQWNQMTVTNPLWMSYHPSSPKKLDPSAEIPINQPQSNNLPSPKELKNN